MSEIEKCIVDKLPSVLSSVLGLSEDYVRELINKSKIKLDQTPDPRLGDYGIALHPLLKNIERSRWETIGSIISEQLYKATREQCWVNRVIFVNGYINFYIDYFNLLLRITRDLLEGELASELSKIGQGRKVIVEHTSANPVHPLHIGSGRNSVIGDTFARLLRKIGFNVETRFYVNDLGRQVATLVYGAKIAESSGISRPIHMKIDHWYGVIYALTHLVMETRRLESLLKEKMETLIDKSEEACRELLVDTNDADLLELGASLCEIAWRRALLTNKLKTIRKIYELVNRLSGKTASGRILEIRKIIDEIASIIKEYQDYIRAERRLSRSHPELYAALTTSIRSYDEAEKEITRLMNLAEREDQEVLSLFHKVSESVLTGFKETLSKINVEFDGFDYESSEAILRTAHEIVEKSMATPYARVIEGGAVEIDLNKLASIDDRVKNLFYPDQPGRFVIRRSDGTTLYVTRDIAYTLYKFRVLGASKVYNVIAVEQSREQKQLKSVLYMLGCSEFADNLYHFPYEMVHLKGMRMSGRRGIYYTIDELIIDNKVTLLRKLIGKTKTDPKELESIVERLAIANTRAILLSVEPSKVLVFDPKKLGEFEHGIIVEYSFVRAQGILRNIWNKEFLLDKDEIIERTKQIIHGLERTDLVIEEKRLLENIARFKRVLIEAYQEMKPNKILEYAVSISQDFNKFYEKCPIAGESDIVKKNTRIILTVLTLIVLSELIDILGFPKLTRM